MLQLLSYAAIVAARPISPAQESPQLALYSNTIAPTDSMSSTEWAKPRHCRLTADHRRLAVVRLSVSGRELPNEQVGREIPDSM